MSASILPERLKRADVLLQGGVDEKLFTHAIYGLVCSGEVLALKAFGDAALESVFDYAASDLGIPSITPSCQLPVKLAHVLYSRILDKIEANDYDVFTRRARTSGLEKAAEFARLKIG